MPSKKLNQLEEKLLELTSYFGPLATDYDKARAKREIRHLFDTHSRNDFIEASETVMNGCGETDPLRHEELHYYISELIDHNYHTETPETVTTLMGFGVVAYHAMKAERPSPFMDSDMIEKLVALMEKCPALHPKAKVKIYPQWMTFCAPLLMSSEATLRFIADLEAQSMPNPVRFPIPRQEETEQGLAENESMLPYSVYPRTLLMTVTTPQGEFIKPMLDNEAWLAWKREMRQCLASQFPGLRLLLEEPYPILGSLDHLENEAGFLRLETMCEHAKAMGYVGSHDKMVLTVALFTPSPKAQENYMSELRFALALNHDPDRPFLGDAIMVGSLFHPMVFQNRLNRIAEIQGLMVKFIDDEQPFLGSEEEMTFINWSGHPVTLTNPEMLAPKMAPKHLN